MRTDFHSEIFHPLCCDGTAQACRLSADGMVWSLFHGLRALPQRLVGLHDFAVFLPFCPSKHEPLSDSIVAGAPKFAIAFLRTVTAFSDVAWVNICAATMHLEESPRYVTRLNPLKRESLMMRQSTCHIALEYLRSNLTHLCFLDLAADGVTSPLFDIRCGILYCVLFSDSLPLVTPRMALSRIVSLPCQPRSGHRWYAGPSWFSGLCMTPVFLYSAQSL